jgi:hypothetical protein
METWKLCCNMVLEITGDSSSFIDPISNSHVISSGLY